MNVGEETLEGLGIQQWHKGPRHDTAATRQKVNKGHRWWRAAMSEEGEDNHELHRRVELRTVITSGKRRNTQEIMRFSEGRS
jgi:hypothetical protein